MRDIETIYQELTNWQKQAFDHNLDLGDMEAAKAILEEHESRREVKNEGDNEISRK